MFMFPRMIGPTVHNLSILSVTPAEKSSEASEKMGFITKTYVKKSEEYCQNFAENHQECVYTR